MRRLPVLALLPLLLSLAACGETDPDPGTATTASDDPSPPQQESTTSTIAAPDEAADSVATASSTFEAEVWADNWFALYVNGELVGEDSVPITTERSFNSETITFDADYPLTIAIEAKDFKEDDSGLENILGTRKWLRRDRRRSFAGPSHRSQDGIIGHL